MATSSAASLEATSTSDSINAASRLATLPEELLSSIAVKLGCDDICHLRLTCRDVEAKSQHEFAMEYFSAKCFMFTTESLKVLVNIAHSPKLRRYLKQVYFITVVFPESPLHCRSGCHWSPSIRNREAYRFYVDDKQRLQDLGQDRRFLVEAFKNLPELTTLCIVDAPSSLPENAECRGLNKFRRTTTMRPFFAPTTDAFDSFEPEYCIAQTHVFKTMLAAVAESGITSVTALTTRLRPDSPYHLSPITDLKFKQSTIDKLAVAFRQLNEVKLGFRTRLLRPGRGEDKPQDLERSQKIIKSFAPVIHSATSLSLTFDSSDWSGAMFQTLSSQLDLERLAKLALNGIGTDMTSLVTIICKLRSVSFLTLYGVALTGPNDSWVPILEAIKRLPALQHVHLHYLQISGQRVYFLQQPDSNDNENNLWYSDGPLPEMDHSNGDGWYDAEDYSDDEPPDLVPQENELDDLPDLVSPEDEGQGEDSPQIRKPSPPLPKPKAPVNKCKHFTGKDYKAPGNGAAALPERGYYICLPSVEDIQEQLPRFMKEYNVGGSVQDPMDYNGILNTILGGPVPAGGTVMGGNVITLPPIAVPPNFMPPPFPQNAGGAQGGNAPAGAAPQPNDPGAAFLASLQGIFGAAVNASFPPAPPGAQPPAGDQPQAAGGAPNAQAASQEPQTAAPQSTVPADGAPGQHHESDEWMFEDHENDSEHGWS
ncbi:Hypothetical predicted protein [Lecanosticta acicola]|uniref:F-box domain-containing protein n=1 Tax=Lecanosticta acicola TaxID=111012 RepID=A0AAI8YUG3_9PEZI|nr:Hypothetical predicted protein [Lecanosticta acicola]